MKVRLLDLCLIWGEPVHKTLIDMSTKLGHVCTDSRQLVKGDFFIPLLGENFDGHKFLHDAYEKGAQAAIISNKCNIAMPKDFMFWRVEDTLKAYQEVALVHRKTLASPVIAVTGSVGKTTTKELIASVLKTAGSIAFTKGNQNNDIGVPFTLLSADTSDRAIVVEMGMRGLGEIERLSFCTQPDIAVITNIGTSHIGRLGSRENIAKAKCEIVSYLNPKGLVVILGGDPLLDNELKKNWEGRVIRVGIEGEMSNSHSTESINMGSEKVDYLGVLDKNTWTIRFQNISFELPVQGVHIAKNFMLALAVAKELKINLSKPRRIELGITNGRNNSINIGGVTILDETYNASPESVVASLDLLSLKPGRKFVVLGNMLELGDQSLHFHRKVVEHAVRLGVNGILICANGSEANVMLQAAKSSEYVALTYSPEAAFKVLITWIKEGDYILLKASRSISLEKILLLLSEYYDSSS